MSELSTRREIIARLDLISEYQAMGITFAASKPTAKGWLTCYAAGRKDTKPSAGVNISSGPSRGRYIDRGGDGENLSFIDFAVKYGGYADWQAAEAHFAHKVGLSPKPSPSSKGKKDKPSALKFSFQSPFAIKNWCARKPKITPEAVALLGGKLGYWPANLLHGAQNVLAFPIFNPSHTQPVGWAMVNQQGGNLSKYCGKDQPRSEHKVLLLAGSGQGFFCNPDALRTADTVWKCEGATDTLAVLSALPEDMRNMTAISNSGGSTEWPQPSLLTALSGKTVYVLHDADQPGRIGSRRWAEAIATVAKEVREVHLPYPVEEKHGKDARDYLASHSYADLLALAEKSSPLLPTRDARSAVRQFLEDALGIDVLGERSDLAIECYSTRLRKLFTVRDIHRFSYATLIQCAGADIQHHVIQNKEPDEGVSKVSMTAVQNMIAAEAAQRRIAPQDKLGNGAWLLHDTPVLINAGSAYLIQDDTIQPHTSARYIDHILDFSIHEPWFDESRLSKLLHSPYLPQRVYQALSTTMAMWNWKHPGSHEIAAGLILATWVQTFWNWRPIVSVTGNSNSGKTTLIERVLQPLFGRLCLSTNRPTEAGLRQEIRNTATVILLDEFEADRNRPRVLELLRTSSRGGSVVRGTRENEPVRYGLKHIVWTFAIESGLQREPDANRFVALELRRAAAAGFVPPDRRDSRRLGDESLAAALRLYPTAAAHAAAIVAHYSADRFAESYSVPIAMIAAATSEDPIACYERLTSLRDKKQRSFDEEDLIADILSAQIQIGGGESQAISEILSSPDKRTRFSDSLERHGIALTSNRRGPRSPDLARFLFLSPRVVQRYLLRNTRWTATPEESVDIAQLLSRIPGSQPSRQRVAGTLQTGYLIPVESFKTSEEEPEVEL